jgi:hypothetical protein
MDILGVPVAYPLASANPTVRADAALPAAGAWDADPVEFNVWGYSTVTFYITYTRGAVGGEVDWIIESSPRSADAAGVED